jgi:hypothetical protein
MIRLFSFFGLLALLLSSTPLLCAAQSEEMIGLTVSRSPETKAASSTVPEGAPPVQKIPQEGSVVEEQKSWVPWVLGGAGGLVVLILISVVVKNASSKKSKAVSANSAQIKKAKPQQQPRTKPAERAENAPSKEKKSESNASGESPPTKNNQPSPKQTPPKKAGPSAEKPKDKGGMDEPPDLAMLIKNNPPAEKPRLVVEKKLERHTSGEPIPEPVIPKEPTPSVEETPAKKEADDLLTKHLDILSKIKK